MDISALSSLASTTSAASAIEVALLKKAMGFFWEVKR